jgi:hypothetical protein
VQKSFPGCTVTVYNTGTLTLSTIFSDANETPLANPFTANATTGAYQFFVLNGGYDIVISATGLPAFTQYSSVKISNASAGIGGSGTAGFLPAFTSSSNVGNSVVEQVTSGRQAAIVTQGNSFSAELDLQVVGGTNYVALKAPATISAPLTFTLPNADGTSGQGLITDGSGHWSFATTTCATCLTSGNVPAGQLVIGNDGAHAVAGLGSLGSTTTVLHGNASGNPSFGAVVLTTDVSGALPAANGGTGVNNGSNTATFGGLFSTAGAVSFTGANTTTFATLGTAVITIPAATDTIDLIATAQTLTNKTITASSNILGGVTMGLGSDATGDTYYNNGGVLTRLPVGSPGQFLGVSGGVPAWGSPTGSGTVNSGGAADLPYYAATGTTLSDAGPALTWNGSNLLMLGVASTTTGNLGLGNAATAGVTFLQGGAATANRTVIFPATDPGANQVLGAAGLVGSSIQLIWTANGGSPNAVLNNQVNTYTTGLQDFSAVSLKAPSGASFTTTINGDIGFDTTAFRFGGGGAGGVTSVYALFVTPGSTDTFTNKIFDTGGAGNVLKVAGTSITAVSSTNGTATLGSFTGTFAANDCIKIDVNGNLTSAGGACTTSAGGSAAWDQLTNPSSDESLSMSTHKTTMSFADLHTAAGWTMTFGALTTSPAINQFTIFDTTGNTNTGALVDIHSVGTSTALPLQVHGQGTANGWHVTAAGVLVADGTGGVSGTAITTGTVAKARLGTAVFTDQANTYSTGLQDLTSATFKAPNSAGAAPATSALFAYDTTSNEFVGGVNGTTTRFAMFGANTQLAGTPMTLTGTATSGGTNLLVLAPGASTAITANTPDVLYTAPTITVSATTVTEQDFWSIGQPTIAGSAAGKTVTTASTFTIAGAPASGTNSPTLTSAYALWVKGSGTELDGFTRIKVSGATAASTARGLEIDDAGPAWASAPNALFAPLVVNVNQFSIGLSPSVPTVYPIMGAVDLPSTATSGTGASAVVGVVSTESTASNSNAVGVFGWGYTNANNTHAWGSNFGARSLNLSGTTIWAGEFDINTTGSNQPSQVIGVDVVGNLGVQATGITDGVRVYYDSPAASNFKNAFHSAPGAAVTGLELDQTASSGNSLSSQPIKLVGTNSSGTAETATIQGDLNGNLIMAEPVSMVHVGGSGSAPTIAGGTGAGTSPTISIAGTDMGMNVTVLTGSSPAGSNATIATVTFATAFAATPTAIIMTPINPNAAALSGATNVAVPITSWSTTGFIIQSGTSALAATTTYHWSIIVVGK